MLYLRLATTESNGNGPFDKFIGIAKCGSCSEYLEGHIEQQFGKAFIGKGVGDKRNILEVQDHLVSFCDCLNEWEQLLTYLLAQHPGAQFVTELTELESYHIM